MEFQRNIMMRPQYPLPRIPMILALSVICVWIPLTSCFKLGHNYPLNYRFSGKYKDVLGPATFSTSNVPTEELRTQHKRSDRSGSTDGVDGNSGFLTIRTIPPKMVQAREHGQTMLECSVSGAPAPSVTWYKDGLPLIQVPKITYHPLHPLYGTQKTPTSQVEQSMALAYAKLELDCITPEDAGFYECVASNGKKSQRFATEVHVASFPTGSCKPRMLHQSPPQIMEHYVNYLLELGYDAHLKCLTIGRHSTTWLTPTDEPIEGNSEKYQIKPDGSLIIRDLDFADMGTYRCLVKNEFGSDQIETFVYPVSA